MTISSPRSRVLVVAAAFFSVTLWLAMDRHAAEEALIDRRYAEAVQILEKALGTEPAAEHDDLLLLLGRARALAGDIDGAVEAYRRLARDFPDSEWHDKAQLQLAETLARAGDHGRAAEVYRAQIERLIGPERKKEIAATYLGLAADALTAEPPRPGTAVSFYDLAVDLGLADAEARRIGLLAAEASLQAGQIDDAARRFEALRDGEAEPDALVRIRLGLGRARIAQNRLSEARVVLRDLIAAAPASPEAGDAAWEIARSWGVPTPVPARLDAAVGAVRELAANHPEHPKARLADYLIAECLLHCGRTEAGLAALQAFLAAHGDEDLAEVPRARSRIGDVYAGQGRLVDAIDAWRAYLSAHPAHEDWERVQRAIVDAEFERAERARRAERTEEAEALYAQFMREHPLDPRNPRILVTLADMDRAAGDLDDAVATYGRCVSKYPGRAESSEAQFRIGTVHEVDRFDYQRALDAYRAVTWGPFQAEARARIARLELPALRLEVPRTYRSSERPSFRVVSRNVPEVRVRVWRLELESLFRATHLAAGVDALDIEVIAADEVFQSPVADYMPYRETARDVAVEVGGKPGCYVVKIDDQRLEATGMVLVTDLGLIVKASRHGFLAFTQNLAEDRVESGVRVVLSDGQSIVAEGMTGADGTWSFDDVEVLQKVGELRAFAVDAAGSGAGTLDLGGLGFSAGLTPKTFLVSDRPAYRPGSTVRIKGITREVRDGVYALPAGTSEYRVRVEDPAGRAAFDEAVGFTAFGTFAFELPLDVDAMLGEWHVSVRALQPGASASTAAFEVAEFELPRLSIQGTASARVVRRGEAIEGRFEVRHFYGGPAVGRTVRYWIHYPGGARTERTAETNAEGAVRFSFDSAEFGEEAIARIDAVVDDAGISSTLLVPVVLSDVQLSARTLRDVYLSGEPFDVRVEVRDRAGEPLARPVRYELFRLEETARGRAEVSVMTAEARTSGETGEGHASLRAAEGGPHVVRIAVDDASGTSRTTDVLVMISGADDAVKLRLLSDSESTRVGERLRVRVVNRAGERLALQTVQGDGILAHRALRIPAGESDIELLMGTEHAPNFGLALSMIDGTELRVAQRDYLVSRDLRIEVVAPDRDIAPGSDFEVELKVTRSDGRPARAELALGMIEEALFARYPDRTPAIGPFFFGQRRETTFRTASSCGWHSASEGQPVDRALVAEEQRIDELQRAVPDRNLDDSLDARRAGEKQVLLGLAEGRPIITASPDSQAASRFRGILSAGRAPAADQHAMLEAYFARPSSDPAEMPVLGGNVTTWSLDAGSLRLYADAEGLSGWNEVAKGSAFDSTAWNSAIGLGGGLASAGPAADPVRWSSDGAWAALVATDDEGLATLTLRAPDRSSGWRLQAYGVTAETDVGAARATVRTASPLVVGVEAPPVLTAGDRPTVRGSVHNRGDGVRSLDVAWRNGTPVAVRLEGRTEEHLRRSLEAVQGDAVEIGLDVTEDGSVVSTEARSVPVLPFGVEKADGAAGVTSERARARVALEDPGRGYSGLALRIELAVDDGIAGLAGVVLDGPARHNGCVVVDRTNLATIARGQAALALLQRRSETGAGERTEVTRLESVVRSVAARLVSLQADDGSFRWIGRGQGDVAVTAAALRFLAAAVAWRGDLPDVGAASRRAGDWLTDQVARLGDAERVDTAWALAVAGRVRFETLNALHRQRASLGPVESARLGLAWASQSRPERVGELTDGLRAALEGWLAQRREDPTVLRGVALAVRALRAAGGLPGVTEERARTWLEARLVAASLGGAVTAGAVVEALAEGAVRAGVTEQDSVRCAVLVDGEQVGEPRRVGSGHPEVVPVDPDRVSAAGHSVEIVVEGAGRVRWNVVLSGFAADFRDEDRDARTWWIHREYLPAPRRVDGRPVEPGFSVVDGRHDTWRDGLASLGVGSVGRVETRFSLRREADREVWSPLVVEEPLPAGVTVPRDSVRGSFEHVEVLPDRLVCYYRPGVTSDLLRYDLVGRFEGSYRALPTRVRGALRPDLIAYGPVGTLEVLPHGIANPDPRRLTPDELFALGKAAYAAGDHAAAKEHLGALAKGWTLREGPAREVAERMLIASIRTEDARGTVQWFEEVKERHADFVVPFADILAVGRSYMDLGESESAVLVFRATAEASFLKEARVATTLEQRGEVAASVQFLDRLLATYPDLETMRLSLYGVGQKLAALAVQQPAAGSASIDERIGSAEELRANAMRAFRRFLIHYPEDPLAPEVSFSWATTALEGDDLATALEIAKRALARYGDSVLEDELLYTVGYAQFALRRPDAAVDALRRVATEEFTRGDGTRGPSENRRHAIYLEGQVHHARGEIEAALTDYDAVSDAFSDAAEAADWFRRRELEVAEVTTLHDGDADRVEVSYRNLESVTALLYRVDLMRLYLLEKSLQDVAGIQLHGIAPLFSAEVDLEGADFRGHRRVLELPPVTEAGAYLLVLRSGSLIRSGLVLRTDLDLAVEEDPVNGRLRVNVSREGAVVGQAHVKVVGSQDGEIRSGDADLRGVYSAGGLVGRATVLVRDGEDYAFHRGDAIHQPGLFRPERLEQAVEALQTPEQQLRFDALENNLQFNEGNRARQVDWLDKNVLQVEQRGVEVRRTK